MRIQAILSISPKGCPVAGLHPHHRAKEDGLEEGSQVIGNGVPSRTFDAAGLIQDGPGLSRNISPLDDVPSVDTSIVGQVAPLVLRLHFQVPDSGFVFVWFQFWFLPVCGIP